MEPNPLASVKQRLIPRKPQICFLGGNGGSHRRNDGIVHLLNEHTQTRQTHFCLKKNPYGLITSIRQNIQKKYTASQHTTVPLTLIFFYTKINIKSNKIN